MRSLSRVTLKSHPEILRGEFHCRPECACEVCSAGGWSAFHYGARSYTRPMHIRWQEAAMCDPLQLSLEVDRVELS